MVIYIAGSIPLFRGKRSNHFRLQRQSKHGAAHLHRDEETPHIHVTLVPIVKGERKRRKREEQTKKRYRKKPTDTVRLCADDIMTRLKLKSYQDTYAVAMAKYGLQRGIDGSKARHKSTQQYYRDIQKLADNLKAEVVDLQQQKETAREELRRAKKEIQTEKLKRAEPPQPPTSPRASALFSGATRSRHWKGRTPPCKTASLNLKKKPDNGNDNKPNRCRK